jgi:hypothetical protein
LGWLVQTTSALQLKTACWWYLPMSPHSITTQNVIFTAIKTQNLTEKKYFEIGDLTNSFSIQGRITAHQATEMQRITLTGSLKG